LRDRTEVASLIDISRWSGISFELDGGRKAEKHLGEGSAVARIEAPRYLYGDDDGSRLTVPRDHCRFAPLSSGNDF
jgi:hypothetical protein